MQWKEAKPEELMDSKLRCAFDMPLENDKTVSSQTLPSVAHRIPPSHNYWYNPPGRWWLVCVLSIGLVMKCISITFHHRRNDTVRAKFRKVML